MFPSFMENSGIQCLRFLLWDSVKKCMRHYVESLTFFTILTTVLYELTFFVIWYNLVIECKESIFGENSACESLNTRVSLLRNPFFNSQGYFIFKQSFKKCIIIVCMDICVHACVCVCTCMCACVHAWGGQWLMSGVFLYLHFKNYFILCIWMLCLHVYLCTMYGSCLS